MNLHQPAKRESVTERTAAMRQDIFEGSTLLDIEIGGRVKTEKREGIKVDRNRANLKYIIGVATDDRIFGRSV